MDSRQPTSHRRAFTLVEMIIVLALLVILAGVALLRGEDTIVFAQRRACEATLIAVRSAILGSESGPGFRSDVGTLPTTIADLLRTPNGIAPFDETTGFGWNGPYLASGIAHESASPDPAVLDSWGKPIVLQIPGGDGSFARLVSAGPNRVVETSDDTLDLDPSASTVVGDDLVLYLTHIPGSAP